MLTTCKRITTVSIMIILGSLLVEPVCADERPSIREGKSPVIDITRIKPSNGDLRRIRQKQKEETAGVKQEDQVFAVRIYVKMPRAGARGWELYLGDVKIEEYGSFVEGIFFKVYDRKNLELWK